MAGEWLPAADGIVGVLAGSGLTLSGEHVRRSGDRADKDMTLLRELSAAFLAAAVQTSDASFDVWHSRHQRAPDGRFGHLPLADALAVEQDAWPRFMAAYFALRVVAPTDIVDAAGNLYRHVKDYSQRTTDPHIEAAQWDEDWKVARDQVLNLVRQEVAADRARRR
jgi:hypothetical protein